MTAPIQEPTQSRIDEAQAFRSRQLFRRPALGTSVPVWVNYEIKLFNDTTEAVVADGVFYFPIPEDLNGLHLVAGACGVSTVGGSGTMTVQVQNVGDETTPLSDDMFSTEITIDAGKNTSYHSAVQPVVDTAVDQVFTGQTLRVDVDTIPASDGLGLAIVLSFDSVPGGTGAIGPPGPTGPTGPTGSGNVATDSIWDAKGDVAAATGADAAVAVPVGTDGQVLTADSGETAGVKWADPPSGTQDGWNTAGETWTYDTADSPTFTFKVAADVTGKYAAGQRIKLTQTSVKYFIVTKVSAFSGGNTTITIYGGTGYTLANAAISSPYWSMLKAPFGFPLEPESWTVEKLDTTIRSQSTPTNSTWYNLGSVSMDIPIGSWRVYYEVNVEVTRTSSSNGIEAYVTLSTANNSETDKKWTCLLVGGTLNASNNDWSHTFHREQFLTVTAKSTRYLNSMSDTSAAILYNRNDIVTLAIRAVSSYL